MIENNLKSRKKLNIFFAVCMTGMYCLYCFALVPLGNMYANNIQYMYTILPTVIEFIYDLIDIMAISLAYAVALYSIYAYGLGKTKISILIFVAVKLFEYMSNLGMTWLEFGFDVGNLVDDLAVGVLAPMCLEILQYLIVILVGNKILSRYIEGVKKREHAAQRHGLEQKSDPIYPFKNLFHLKNPMVKCAFWSGIIVVISKVSQRIMYDTVLSLFEGAPKSSEIPVMVIYYFSDMLTGLVCYLFVVWFVMLFFQKKIKRELYEKK